MGDLTVLIGRAGSGDREAADALFRAVYDDLRGIAARQLARGEGGGLGRTSLVHEACLRLVRPEALAMNDRVHFFAVAARAMRQVAVDHARERIAAKRGGGAADLPLDAARGELAEPSRHARLLALDEALAQLEAVDGRLARFIELRFFAGTSLEETAELMSSSLATTKRELRKARAFLHARLGEMPEGVAGD
jgi:RNA polymerase sigma factor (TIGR02999 family)